MVGWRVVVGALVCWYVRPPYCRGVVVRQWWVGMQAVCKDSCCGCWL